jgi:hypothetical protein
MTPEVRCADRSGEQHALALDRLARRVCWSDSISAHSRVSPCPVQTRRKIRTRLGADAIIGGILGTLVEPEALIVGRHDGRLRIAGRTTPLTRPTRHDLAAVLTPADHDHPWPPTIPASRFGHRPSEPVHYVQAAPTTIVELDVDTAYEHHRWRHPSRFVRIRADLHPQDLSPWSSDAWSD